MRSALRITLLLMLFGFALPSLTGAEEMSVNITGTWEGAIDVKGTELGIVVDFLPGQDVEWMGEIDIEVQGAIDLALDNILIDNNLVHFEMPGALGGPFFDGTLADDHRAMSGEFTQGGSIFPFELVLVDEHTVARAQTTLKQRLDRLRQFVDTVRHAWQVPGVGVGIVHKGRLVMAEGFGWRSLADNLPVTRRTYFPIGSATKPFTATSLAMLVADGDLNWDEPIKTYLPDFRLMDDYCTEHITVRDLVTHRSGLPRHDAVWYNSPATRAELVSRLQYLQPNLELREKFQYQNLMYLAAGFLVEHITARPWEDFVQQMILDSLNMTRTNFAVTLARKSPDHATPYRLVDGQQNETPFREVSTMGPAGSINSCVNDMTRWLRFQLNKGMNDFEMQLIPTSLVSEMHTPQIVVGQPEEYLERLNRAYGLGWFIESYRGHKHVYHGGNIDGFTAMASFFPNDNLGVVVLANLDATPLADIVALMAADLFLGMEPVDHHDRAWLQHLTAREITDQAELNRDKLGRIKGTKPSHKLEAYAGEFEHPGYGVVTITKDGKKLRAVYNGLEATLDHWHYDLFMAEFAELADQQLAFQFQSNSRGDISAVAIPMEPLVDRQVFVRKPDSRLTDPEYLSRFTGAYNLSGQSLDVVLRGTTLVAILPGQPAYDLLPYRGVEFHISGLVGYSIEFTEKDDQIAGLRIYQPDGVFAANRMKPDLPEDSN